MNDHESVASYATRGLRLWQEGKHLRYCRCLSCADARVHLQLPAMTPPMVPALQREEQAAS